MIMQETVHLHLIEYLTNPSILITFMQNHSQKVYTELLKLNPLDNTNSKPRKIHTEPDIKAVRKHYNLHSWG